MKSSEIIQIGLEIWRDISKQVEEMAKGKIDGGTICRVGSCDGCIYQYPKYPAEYAKDGNVYFCKNMAFSEIVEKLPETDRQKVISGFDKADKMKLSLNLKKIRRRLSYDEKQKLKKLKKDCSVFESASIHMGFYEYAQSRHLISWWLCDFAKSIEEDDGEDDEYSAWLHNWEKAIEEAIEEGEEDER